VLDAGEPRYLAERGAGIAAWFDTTLDQLKVFDITAS
jgi:hypothetical protein